MLSRTSRRIFEVWLLIVVVSAELHLVQTNLKFQLLPAEGLYFQGFNGPLLAGTHGLLLAGTLGLLLAGTQGLLLVGTLLMEKLPLDGLVLFYVLVRLGLLLNVLVSGDGRYFGLEGRMGGCRRFVVTEGVEGVEGAQRADDVVDVVGVGVGRAVVEHDPVEEEADVVDHGELVVAYLLDQPDLFVLVLQPDLLVLEQLRDLVYLLLPPPHQLAPDRLQLHVQLAQLLLRLVLHRPTLLLLRLHLLLQV